ncbi:AbrB/MazE/SpoVT family DNA-binding domain-containing protein [Pseudomonas sp. xss_1]|uniref:AbrB/MazE/SpoVT family DNA-binding domain-containing protein n=1 Tax=Pseudomonas sp. xss_1 TaxID=3367214 RepID=UPI003709DB4B
MNEPLKTTVQSQAADDGSGDLIVNLPTEALNAIGWKLGDLLSIERVNDEIVLKRIREGSDSGDEGDRLC